MNPDRKARELPLGEELSPTIERLRAIAAASGDALLSEGPVHPDHELLDVCAEALHHRRRAAELREACNALPPPYGNPPATPEQNRLREKLSVHDRDARSHALRLSRRAAKLRARTPAGIYAKALVARSSRTAAAVLAMTLAEDLIGCEALRATLWPGEAQ